jgi:hypothetical protein
MSESQSNRLRIPMSESQNNRLRIPMSESQNNRLRIPMSESQNNRLRIPMSESQNNRLMIPMSESQDNRLMILWLRVKTIGSGYLCPRNTDINYIFFRKCKFQANISRVIEPGIIMKKEVFNKMLILF